ncbi:MAG TPA: hypothetical protein VF988_15405 [Verrucomicrobiae bacterium]
MARANEDSGSLRFSRRERALLIAALLLSMFAHISGFGVWEGWEFGRKHGWWKKFHLPNWLQTDERKALPPVPAPPSAEGEIFVDVSHADADAPDVTPYYSDKNSRAANEQTANANVPKINGSQTVVAKTDDISKAVKGRDATPAEKPAPSEPAKAGNAPPFAKLQPSPGAPAENRDTSETPGETELQQAKNKPTTPTASAQPQRPRKLKEAASQQSQIPGQAMQQAGGVPRHALWSSLDAKATPFGEYDRAIVEAVSQRWYDLLDSRQFAQDRTGRVVLHFKLKPDGSVIEMQTDDNTVGQLLGYLCQESIEEAAPFAKWPPDMARMIGANYREITFTFYYY